MITSWLLAMLWLSPATGVAGSQSEQAIHRNVDGSQLRISQHPCDAVGNRVMRVELRLLLRGMGTVRCAQSLLRVPIV